jgi:hypothetical protein
MIGTMKGVLAGVFYLLALITLLRAAEPQSSWARFDESGKKLVYQTLASGDRIMDFSYAGYMGGGVALPVVPAKKSVRPSGKDDTAAIQAAIDEVSKLPVTEGIRGAVFLDGAKFLCSGSLVIAADGVVLRGLHPAKTAITMTGKGHRCILVNGSRSARAGKNSTKISDHYVPSGESTFTVENPAGFRAGDTVLIHHPATPEWVAFMGMEDLTRDGKKETWVSGEITTERSIKEVNGNKITLDIPLSDCLDSSHLNSESASLSQATVTGGISEVGIENLSIRSPSQPVEITAEHHSGIELEGVTDCWVRDVMLENTVGSVDVRGARRVTVTGVRMNHSTPTKGAAKPADIGIAGSQILIDRCSGRGDEVFYVATSSRVTGPNVVLGCDFRGKGWIQPHMRWATGLLVDNCQVPEGGIDLINRGIYGSGHGWTIGWAVAWNCTADSFIIQAPPGSTNWAIGCRGTRQTQPMPGSGKGAPALPEGVFDSHNHPVAPRSLYLAQLEERLGRQAVKNIGF